MTKLLEQAVAQLRELPDDMQDKAARQLIRYVDEVSSDERSDLADGLRAYQQGSFKSLAQWRNDMGLGDH